MLNSNWSGVYDVATDIRNQLPLAGPVSPDLSRLLKQFAHQRYYKNEPCFIEGFLGGKSTFKETFILMHRNEPRIQNLNPI